jgi:hypothetical protein
MRYFGALIGVEAGERSAEQNLVAAPQLVVHSVPQEGRAPREPGAECDETHQVAGPDLT